MDGDEFLKVLGLLLLIVFICLISNTANNTSIGNSRREQGMILITDGFVYDAKTKIIYRETISGRSKHSYDKTFYSPYVSADGDFFQYIDGEWVELD
jgi:hypothetical protein